jgi:hypothetical protein
MRRFDKNKNMQKANQLAEQRHLESNSLIRENEIDPVQETFCIGGRSQEVKDFLIQNEMPAKGTLLYTLNTMGVRGVDQNQNQQSKLAGKKIPTTQTLLKKGMRDRVHKFEFEVTSKSIKFKDSQWSVENNKWEVEKSEELPISDLEAFVKEVLELKNKNGGEFNENIIAHQVQ